MQKYLDMTIRVTLDRKLFRKMGRTAGNVWNYKRNAKEPEDFYDYIGDEIEGNVHANKVLQARVLAASMFIGNADVIKVSPVKVKKSTPKTTCKG